MTASDDTEPMRVDVSGGRVTVDAEALAPLLGVEPARLPEMMRDGAVKTRYETGEGEDAGRFRMTFWHGDLCVRLTCSQDGTVLKTSRIRSAPPPD